MSLKSGPLRGVKANQVLLIYCCGRTQKLVITAITVWESMTEETKLHHTGLEITYTAQIFVDLFDKISDQQITKDDKISNLENR